MKRITQATGIARETLPLLKALQPGGQIIVSLPESRYWRHEAYRHVRSAAQRVLGRGTFTTDVRTSPGNLIVTSIPQKHLAPDR